MNRGLLTIVNLTNYPLEGKGQLPLAQARRAEANIRRAGKGRGGQW